MLSFSCSDSASHRCSGGHVSGALKQSRIDFSIRPGLAWSHPEKRDMEAAARLLRGHGVGKLITRFRLHPDIFSKETTRFLRWIRPSNSVMLPTAAKMLLPMREPA